MITIQSSDSVNCKFSNQCSVATSQKIKMLCQFFHANHSTTPCIHGTISAQFVGNRSNSSLHMEYEVIMIGGLLYLLVCSVLFSLKWLIEHQQKPVPLHDNKSNTEIDPSIHFIKVQWHSNTARRRNVLKMQYPLLAELPPTLHQFIKATQNLIELQLCGFLPQCGFCPFVIVVSVWRTRSAQYLATFWLVVFSKGSKYSREMIIQVCVNQL